VERFHGVGPATAAKGARDLRRAPAGKGRSLPVRAFRQAWTIFIVHLAGHRSPADCPKSRPQVGCSREHVLAGPNELDDMRAELGPLSREGLALLRWHRGARTDSDAQSKVRGLPDQHPTSIAPCADLGPLDTHINQRRVARGAVSAAERSSPARRVALFAVRDAAEPDTQMTLAL